MALFDEIVERTSERFGLSREKAGGLLSALLSLLTDSERGGFAGFLDRFRNAGFADTVSSWITSGDNAPLSDEQVVSALGEDTIDSIAGESGVDRATAVSALAVMTPQVVNKLTPDGNMPAESDLLTVVGDFSTGTGSADDSETHAHENVPITADRVDAGGEAVIEGRYEHETDGQGNPENPVLSWLAPLILLLIMIILGYWFCSKPPVPPAQTNSDAFISSTHC